MFASRRPATSSSDVKERGSGLTYCHSVLADVSRTFALTIPILENPLDDAVCVAYLLCRIADTIEDRNDLTDETRAFLYASFRDLVAGSMQRPTPRADHQPTRAATLDHFLARWPEADHQGYQNLVEHTGSVLSAFASLDPGIQGAINDCVQEMVRGMEQMAHPAAREGIAYVAHDLETLERYCHYVAGTVGLMLTRLFAGTFAQVGIDGFASTERLEEGRRFGLGLQLTNILKDHREDHLRGTSFFPSGWLDTNSGGLHREQRDRLIRRTLEHLEHAQEFVLNLPRRAVGIRLFCLWALWMAMGTLREVARARIRSPKISRIEVAQIIAYSRAHVSDDKVLAKKFSTLYAEVTHCLSPEHGD